MGRYSAALCPTVGVAISSTFGWSLPAHHRDAYQHQMSLSQSLRMDSGEHVEEFLYADIGGLGEVAADFLCVYACLFRAWLISLYRVPIVCYVSASSVYATPTLEVQNQKPV